MELSARNQLKGTVRSLVKGEVMAEVVVEIGGGNTVVAAITRGSAEALHLKPGDEVTALVKATEVMIMK
jgi:molybdopterin-binding protein